VAVLNVEKPSERSARGRPRSERVHQAILQATVDVLGEVGYNSATIEAIAARARVGKKTIYRWWSSKAELVLEALAIITEKHVPFPDTGSLKEDLLAYFESSFAGLQAKSGTALSGLAAEAQLDPKFAREFQRSFIVPRKEGLVTLLKRGVERGELTSGIDVDVLGDLIYGAKWYRFLLYPAPLDSAFAREITEIILRLKD
jgi:AcrR family transcriptional regulator